MAKKTRHSLILPLLLELVALAAVGCGIGVEIVYEAHYGFVLISGGSAVGMMGAIIWGKFLRG